MDYRTTGRDGRASQLSNGRRPVELYAWTSRKNQMLILLEPFRDKRPFSRGQDPIIIEAVRTILGLSGRHRVLVGDRPDPEYRFVVRLPDESQGRYGSYEP